MEHSRQVSNGDESSLTEGMNRETSSSITEEDLLAEELGAIAINPAPSLLDGLSDERRKFFKEGLDVLALLCTKFGVESDEKTTMENIFLKMQVQREPFNKAVALFVIQTTLHNFKDKSESKAEFGLDEVVEYLNAIELRQRSIGKRTIFKAIQEVRYMSPDIDVETLDCEGLLLVDEYDYPSFQSSETESGQGHTQQREWTQAEIEEAISRPISELDFPPEMMDLYFIRDEEEDLIRFRENQFRENLE